MPSKVASVKGDSCQMDSSGRFVINLGSKPVASFPATYGQLYDEDRVSVSNVVNIADAMKRAAGA